MILYEMSYNLNFSSSPRLRDHHQNMIRGIRFNAILTELEIQKSAKVLLFAEDASKAKELLLEGLGLTVNGKLKRGLVVDVTAPKVITEITTNKHITKEN